MFCLCRARCSAPAPLAGACLQPPHPWSPDAGSVFSGVFIATPPCPLASVFHRDENLAARAFLAILPLCAFVDKYRPNVDFICIFVDKFVNLQYIKDMSNPLKSYVMEEKFSKIVALIESLNALKGKIGKEPRFNYEFVGSRMYICGFSVDISLLFSLLWSSCDGYCIYIDRDDDGTYIEVLSTHNCTD